MSKRIRLIDTIRGFSVVSMVLFHLCYDLVNLKGLELSWFMSPFEDIWRSSISWTFLFISGAMCALSKSNIKRSIKLLILAALISLITTVAAVDDPISFGIIFCLGASCAIVAILQKIHRAPRGYGASICFVVLFLLLRQVPNKYIGLGLANIELPMQLYASDAFSFLGFPGPTFVSGDYYPLIPFSLMYFAGTSWGSEVQSKGFPTWTVECGWAPLEWIGRHALLIYIIHQPILLLMLSL